MNRVAIYGMGGLYNYGCEAILRGTVEYIHQIYGDEVRITYYSRNIEDDYKIVKDIGIEIIDIRRKTNLYRKIVSKVVDVFEIPLTPFFDKEFDLIINNSDIIVSVGGDIYTIPQYLRDKKKYRYVNYLVEFGEKAISRGRKIIIYGASIGPFGRYTKAINYYSHHLSKVDQIVCREMASVKYLKTIGVSENVVFLPDPAFLVKKDKCQNTENYVGINLSELSLVETYGKVSEEKLYEICQLLNTISNNANLPLMLIPHVFSPHATIDNDYLFLGKVFEGLSDAVKEKSVLVKPEGFLDAKHYLKQCKIVVAARMHCAVNALIEDIPTIFLSYSQKSRGMANFIYGDEKWCVSLKQMKTNLITTFEELNSSCEIVRGIINKRLPEINKMYADYFEKYGIVQLEDC